MGNSTSTIIELHQKFMIQAIYEAEKAERKGEVPVGAVIVKGNTIIGRGYNQVETLNDPTAHAEIIAITSACATIESKYLTDSTIYVTLEPCAMCTGALVWSKIDRIVYGASDPKSGCCGSALNLNNYPTFNHHIQVIQGVLENDCSELLRQFFSGKR
jgi:tRNA(adenine34) deaminase